MSILSFIESRGRIEIPDIVEFKEPTEAELAERARQEHNIKVFSDMGRDIAYLMIGTTVDMAKVGCEILNDLDQKAKGE